MYLGKLETFDSIMEGWGHVDIAASCLSLNDRGNVHEFTSIFQFVVCSQDFLTRL